MAIRVGFIGTGGIANAHMGSLSRIPGVKMVGFCDVVQEKAKAAAEKYGGKHVFTDFQEMLDAVEMDACYICVPPHAHVGQEELCAKKGIPFLVEKPIARTWETCKKIAAAVRKAKLLTCVGYHWRYYDTTESARRLLEGQSIGMVLGYWMGGLPGVHWWRVAAQSGGQILEQTTHICDLARYFAGDVKRVYGALALRAMTDVEDLDVPDVGTVTVEFESGAVGVINNTCMLSQGYTVGLHIVCRDLVIEHNGGHLMVRTKDGVRNVDPLASPNFEINKAFVHAVKTGDGSGIKSPYDDAVKSTAISIAAIRSAETGSPVDLKDL